MTDARHASDRAKQTYTLLIVDDDRKRSLRRRRKLADRQPNYRVELLGLTPRIDEDTTS